MHQKSSPAYIMDHLPFLGKGGTPFDQIAVPNMFTKQKAGHLLQNMWIMYMRVFLIIVIATNLIIKQNDKDILKLMLNLGMIVFVIVVVNVAVFLIGEWLVGQ